VSTHTRLEALRVLAVTLSLSICVALSSRMSVDQMAETEFEGLFQRALVTFALARTLNGVISVVQGTEVALQPAGVGVTLTPGEILDPVNDLVEQFSWIILAAAISLGIQQVLLDIGQWWMLRLIVGIVSIAWLLIWLSRKRRLSNTRGVVESVIFRALIVVLFLRFAVPVAFILNEWVYDLFLESRYLQSIEVIESAGTEFQHAAAGENSGMAEPTPGIASLLSRAWETAKEELALDRRLEFIKRRATEVITHLVQLSVVFVLQTVVFPIAFLWLVIVIFKHLLRLPDRSGN
jgi:hypothetical protein